MDRQIDAFEFDQRRMIWASTRAVLETDNYKHKKSGKKSRSHWSTFEKILGWSKFFLRISGVLANGRHNALNLKKKEININFDNLPKNFDGFSILHLSDLHIDSMHELPQAIVETIGDEEFDICVISGDYRFHSQGAYKQVLEPLKTIFQKIKTRHGIFAVLGNHDTYQMVFHQQELGLKFLVDESIKIERNGSFITFTGTDDPFKYFTTREVDAMEESGKGFKIALVHTSELVDVAIANNYKLYLCGHTHGGQVCLPGGIPLITHQYEGRKYYRGLWKLNGLTGYTNEGCGVSGIPIRFNTRGEVVKIVLRCKG
ncbi:MAG: metallophosphoesterase family protein [Bacteroidota bacterium]|nr:metallophosphoesterase family protein [Bacteroidota bacterium]